MIYFFESPYQDDIIAQAVNDVTADGALYFSSAGNQGNYSDGTSGTWEGDFRAAGTLLDAARGLHRAQLRLRQRQGGLESRRVHRRPR